MKKSNEGTMTNINNKREYESMKTTEKYEEENPSLAMSMMTTPPKRKASPLPTSRSEIITSVVNTSVTNTNMNTTANNKSNEKTVKKPSLKKRIVDRITHDLKTFRSKRCDDQKHKKENKAKLGFLRLGDSKLKNKFSKKKHKVNNYL